MKSHFCFFWLLLAFNSGLLAQPSYNARLALVSVDTAQRIACYDLQLSNSSDVPWILANYNFALFYDAEALSFRSDSLLLDDVIYDPSSIQITTQFMGSSLPYEDSIGFLRIGMAANDQGITIDTTGNWVSTVRLCFNILFQDITNPTTCVHFNFNSVELANELAVPPNIVQAWISFAQRQDILPDEVIDISPQRTYTSCFVLEENTPDLCSDGIDNDEDGLMDCMDITGCASGILPFRVRSPTCIDSTGLIEVINFNQNLQFSIDGGVTFQSDSSFTGLMSGVYNLVVVRNGILSCAFRTPITIQAANCDEFDSATCADGLDNDGDGLVDCDDPDCQPTITQVLTDEPVRCPDLMDGAITILSLDDSIRFSIDGGVSYQISGNFEDLGVGTYNILAQNTITGCMSDSSSSPIDLVAGAVCMPVVEECSDGRDNDNDGLVDCADPDCIADTACRVFPSVYIPNVILRNSTTNNTFGLSVAASDVLLIESLNIFDRWGSNVHTVENILTSDAMHRWDGSSSGDLHISGIYTYVVVITDGIDRRRLTGEFTML